jgi:prepilin-type N-terminal cleavage/methylation domain-containing protein
MFYDRYGFTLIEVLAVVILLGILAVVIIPQVIDTGEDAKLNTLKSNLGRLRRAIDLYYHQHNNTYPGTNSIDGNPSDTIDGNPIEIASKSKTAFTSQLTDIPQLTVPYQILRMQPTDLALILKGLYCPGILIMAETM